MFPFSVNTSVSVKIGFKVGEQRLIIEKWEEKTAGASTKRSLIRGFRVYSRSCKIFFPEVSTTTRSTVLNVRKIVVIYKITSVSADPQKSLSEFKEIETKKGNEARASLKVVLFFDRTENIFRFQKMRSLLK